MKKLLFVLLMFVSIAGFSISSDTVYVVKYDTVIVKKECPKSRSYKKTYKKSGVKRTDIGKIVWVVLDILEEVVPFLKLLK